MYLDICTICISSLIRPSICMYLLVLASGVFIFTGPNPKKYLSFIIDSCAVYIVFSKAHIMIYLLRLAHIHKSYVCVHCHTCTASLP